MPKIALGFTGCKVNNYEIQVLSEALESAGMEVVSFNDKADCYIINTCTVTSKADTSSRNLIRRAKRISPEAKIAVTGCYAQLKPEKVSRIGIDLLIPNSEKEKIPGKVLGLIGENGRKHVIDDTAEYGSFIISNMRNLTRGFIKIQEGCDRRCTYCTIWMSRGPLKSRNPRYVIDEINRLYDNGYLEVVLTGVHIGKYRYGDLGFPDLLEKILSDTDIPRIRLSSMYPTEVDDRFIRILSDRRICPHVHLSIQSGDDYILKKMGRDYTVNDLRRIIGSLNASIPDITVGGDIITGFPGETDRQFRDSIGLVENTDIHHLHVFSFSARPGTRAAEMNDMVSPEVIKGRTNLLRKLGTMKKTEHLKKFINRDLQVLFENRMADNNGILTGLSENYLRVNASGDNNLRGNIIRVRPHSLENSVLIANIARN
ncbi:MAG: tRNA (N(6)-L-threonylcarbamoyladenosine(37)-C(2))-methylthiotransferase MtaB [Candidatus Zixiibacteriota bacterium]|nr:MAG: tRNA (N(6)-L-threonylcarbamoyladenosine(37)-C(2))-methylthiotransferase MtaB [candidate division Zixibacteria bacterium]